MFCRNCGTEVKDDAKFCPECGTAVEISAQESAKLTEEPEKTVEVKEEEPEKQESKTKGKKALIPLILLVVVLAAAISGTLFYFSPTQKYNRAMKKGDACMDEKAYAEAVTCYSDAISIDKSKEAKKAIVKAYVKYAEECLEQSKYTDAIDNFSEALDYDDDNDDALEGLTAAYIGYGNEKLAVKAYEQATEQFEEAVKLEPMNGEAIIGRTCSYVGFGDEALESGDYDKAEEYYNEAFGLDDINASAYRGMAHLAAVRGDVSYALELLEEGFFYNEGNAELLEEQNYLVEHSVKVAKETEYDNGYVNREEYNEEGAVIKYSDFDRGQLTFETAYDDAGKTIWTKSYRYGSVITESAYEYDERGNQIKYTYTDYDSPELSSVTEKVYDEKNNCLKETVCDAYGQVTYIYIYEYDDKNQQTLSAMYSYYYDSEYDEEPSSTYWEATETEYDEHGNITKSTYSYGDDYSGEEEVYGPSVSFTEWEYDAAGNAIYQKYFNAEGTYMSETRFSYDEKGQKFSEETTSYDYDYFTESLEQSYYNVTEFEYYEDGTTAYTHSVGDNYSSEARYDEEGRQLLDSYSSDGYYYTYQYEYDECGNTVKEYYDSDSVSEVFEYENSYNAFGDLTEFRDVQRGYVTYYTYEYKLVD